MHFAVICYISHTRLNAPKLPYFIPNSMIIYIQIVNLENMKFPLLPLESLNKESFSKIGLRSWLFRKWLGDPVSKHTFIFTVKFPAFAVNLD